MLGVPPPPPKPRNFGNDKTSSRKLHIAGKLKAEFTPGSTCHVQQTKAVRAMFLGLKFHLKVILGPKLAT